jgi:hypothetical protein
VLYAAGKFFALNNYEAATAAAGERAMPAQFKVVRRDLRNGKKVSRIPVEFPTIEAATKYAALVRETISRWNENDISDVVIIHPEGV